MAEHLGEIVRAEILDFIDDSYYKIIAEVLTGSAAGNKYFVAHNGKPPSKQEILIRIDKTYWGKTIQNLKGILTTGFFITSEIPNNFDYAFSEDVILYGIMTENMLKRDQLCPEQEEITSFFDPGYVLENLHYSIGDNNYILPFEITRERQVILESLCQGEIKIKGIFRAIVSYMNHMEKKRIPTYPRLITMHESIKHKILPHIEFLYDRDGYGYVEMQPQR